MFSKFTCIVLAAAVAVHALPAPLPLPAPIAANNNGTRNFTIGNVTYFNQTNGREAACARGIQQWCDNPTKRSFEPVKLRRSVDVGAVNGDEGEGHIASVQADHDDSDGVHVGAVDDGVDVGLGNKNTRRGLDVGVLNSDASTGGIASVQADRGVGSEHAVGVAAVDDSVDVGLGSDSDVDDLFHPYGSDEQ